MKPVLPKNTIEAEIEAKQAAVLYWKRLKYIGLTILCAVVLGACGYYLIWPGISKWRQQRSLSEVDRYERKRDYRRALLTLEQTVQLYPQNWEARRRLANFLERLGQRQGLDAWKEIVRIAPTDSRNLLGLAGAALRFGDLPAARQALAELNQTGQTGADYYRLSAGLALASRDHLGLEAALVELTRLQPADLRVQLNLAIVRIQSPEGAHVEAGRAALIKLAQSESVRTRAVVELLNDMARRWPRPSRERVAAFQDLAQVLTPSQGPRFDPPEIGDPVERLISLAMRQPAPEPEDAGALLSWLILNGRAAAGFEWLDSLPVKTRQSSLVSAAASEAALQMADWPHLQQLLLAGAWGAVPAATINGVFAVREQRNQSALGTEASRWAAVIESGQSSLPALRMLLRLSEAWNWPEEQRQVLVATTRAFASETWAWRRLISQALVRGDSEQLWQIYQRWSRAVPGDTTVQIETAIMGLLLEKRGATAGGITAEWVRLQPANPGAAVAHALALWRGHRLGEALSLLADLPSAALSEPRYALAYGLMLAEAGRARESEQMLNRASADQLLPDELRLIEQARARNQLRLAGPRSS